MNTTKTETTAKKDVTKLQRAIIDGLEDVKAQDIQVFNTEHLSPLFERVIVASGTSNRQTKALAVSVRDAVREAGFGKPRVEGEDNGEWIIVDCGPAVAHIMQPAIRQYYHLEELWGDTPVRIKLGAAKPAQPEAGAKPKRTRKASAEPVVAARKPGKPAVKAAPAGKAKPDAVKTAAAKAPSSRTAAAKTAAAKKVVAKKAPAKSVAGQDTKPMKVLVVKPNVRPPSKSAASAAPRTRPTAKTAGRAAAKTATTATPAAKKTSRATSNKPALKKWTRI